MSESVEKQIEFVFQDPSIMPKLPGRCSVLHLLRRDIFDCLQVDLNTGAELGNRIIWPGIMGILAGIDLLAKLWKGEDEGSVGERFKDFVRKYFEDISGDDSETVYQLRNSVLHSFGWYSKDRRTGKVYRFLVGDGKADGPLIVNPKPEVYVVYWIRLFAEFEAAISRYLNDLKNDNGLKESLAKMYDNYGVMYIGKADTGLQTPFGECETEERMVEVVTRRMRVARSGEWDPTGDKAFLTMTGMSATGDMTTSLPPPDPPVRKKRCKRRKHK